MEDSWERHSPLPKDVERYRRLRAVNIVLNHKIVKTIPRQAYEEIGDALGIRHNGVLEFDSEDMASVMADCCLYDWYEHGKNLVQRYAETHPTIPEGDESYLLQACLEAQYRILVAQSIVPGAGLQCQDVLNGGGLFLMDLAMSHSVPTGNRASHSDHTTRRLLDDRRRLPAAKLGGIRSGCLAADR
jgi:hypothetical protein